MKRGIFGGTFNPVHLGHLFLAEEALHFAQLDALSFVPNSKPPHKDNPRVTAEKRYEMLMAATHGEERFEVSRVELDREGPSYTFDTLHRFPKEESLVFICGADAFNAPWHRLDGVLERLHSVLMAHRAGYSTEIPPQIAELGPEYASKVQFMPFPDLAVSSSDIRRRARESRAHRYLLHPDVYKIAQSERLYTTKS